jgi:hypothetical protein
MRRWLAGLIVAGVLLVPSSAGATHSGDFDRVRHDGNDTERVLDIERVATALTQRRALFSVRTYDQFTADDIDHGSRFQFNLDTKHLEHADFHLYFIYWLATDQILCRLQTDTGLTIGERPANFDGFSLFCGIPKWWLDIREPVQFTVEAVWRNRYVDVAPDQGRYRGL